MIETPEFAPIKQITQRAMFDMCAFGLKIPQADNLSRSVARSGQVHRRCTNSWIREIAHSITPTRQLQEISNKLARASASLAFVQRTAVDLQQLWLVCSMKLHVANLHMLPMVSLPIKVYV